MAGPNNYQLLTTNRLEALSGAARQLSLKGELKTIQPAYGRGNAPPLVLRTTFPPVGALVRWTYHWRLVVRNQTLNPVAIISKQLATSNQESVGSRRLAVGRFNPETLNLKPSSYHFQTTSNQQPRISWQ